MKKSVVVILVVLAVIFIALPVYLLTSGCRHEWQEASCTSSAVCSKCGETQGEALGHDWKEETVRDAGCTEDGSITYICSRCGEERIESNPAAGHNWDGGSVLKEASCTEEGITEYRCTRCGETRKEMTPVKEHDLNEVEVLKVPTCSETGFGCYTCRNCRYSKYATLVKLPHTEKKVMRKPPTCTEDGYYSVDCTVCGEHVRNESIGRLGHTLSMEVIRESTCSESGEVSWKCSLCGEVLRTSPTGKKAHTPSVRIARESTCSEYGILETYCTVCGEVIETENIEKKPHNLSSSTVSPTCEDDGYVLEKCLDCEYEKRTSIEKLGHEKDSGKAVDSECESGIVYSCSRCGKELERDMSASHIYGAVAYCDAEGYHVPCTRCGRMADVQSLEGFDGIRRIIHVDSVENGNIEAVELKMDTDIAAGDGKKLECSFHIDGERTSVRFRIAGGGGAKSNMKILRRIEVSGIIPVWSEGEDWRELLLGKNSDVIPRLSAKAFCTFSLSDESAEIILPGGDDDVTALLVSFLGYAPGETGGIVFYDRGERSDGWRFLEASSSDTGNNPVWGQNGDLETGNDVGTGKGNTTLISEKRLKAVTTAGEAKAYTLGGYSDWFVPSRDELLLMYERLHLNGIGNFKENIYWSSSTIGTSRAYYVDFSSGRVSTDLSFDASRNSGHCLRLVRAY